MIRINTAELLDMVYRIVIYVIHVRGLWIDIRKEEFVGEVAQEILMCCVDRDRGRQLQNVNHRSVGLRRPHQTRRSE